MRFSTRFCALLAALVFGFLFVTPLRAQRNELRSQGMKRIARQPKGIEINGGAPTAANYQVAQTTGTITPGSTQLTSFNCGSGQPGDDCMQTVALPFPYTLYDQTYNAVNISTNGNLQFVSNNSDYGQGDVCFPLPQFNYAILAHWGDLTIAGANEGVFTSVSGSAPDRIFNVEWRASIIGNSPASLNFQVRLYEGQTRFDVIYGTAPGNGREVTVGVQRAAGSPYTEFECHQNALRNGMMLIFTGSGDSSLFIGGRVTDSDGNAVPGATVTLTGGPGDQSSLMAPEITCSQAYPPEERIRLVRPRRVLISTLRFAISDQAPAPLRATSS